MSPLALMLIRKFAGNRGVEANPYFDDPGSAPFNDSTFDANEQLPAKPSNFWQRMAGDDFGDRINSQYLSTLARQPLLQDMARFEKDLKLEEAKELAKIQQQLESQNMSQLGKTAFDTFGDQYQYPLDFSGSDEDIGRRFALAYPQMKDQGLTTFSGSQAAVAKNLADAVASRNAELAGIAQQPFVTPTARDVAATGERQAARDRAFSEDPRNSRFFEYAQQQKLAPNFTVGNTAFNPGLGLTYQGSMPTENTTMRNYQTDPNKPPVMLPQTTRGMTQPSVAPIPGAIPIHNVNPGNPAEVERQNNFKREMEQNYFENYGTTLQVPPAEQRAPVRNQNTPIPEGALLFGNTAVSFPGSQAIREQIDSVAQQQKTLEALLRAARVLYRQFSD